MYAKTKELGPVGGRAPENFVCRSTNACNTSTYIPGTDNHVHSTQGDILYSNGAVKLRNNTFKVRTAEEHVTILRHSGEHWSMEVDSLLFECPIGHRMMIINTTSHRIQEVDALECNQFQDD